MNEIFSHFAKKKTVNKEDLELLLTLPEYSRLTTSDQKKKIVASLSSTKHQQIFKALEELPFIEANFEIVLSRKGSLALNIEETEPETALVKALKQEEDTSECKMSTRQRKEKRIWVQRFTDIQAPLIQKNRETVNEKSREFEEEIKGFELQTHKEESSDQESVGKRNITMDSLDQLNTPTLPFLSIIKRLQYVFGDVHPHSQDPLVSKLLHNHTAKWLRQLSLALKLSIEDPILHLRRWFPSQSRKFFNIHKMSKRALVSCFDSQHSIQKLEEQKEEEWDALFEEESEDESLNDFEKAVEQLLPEEEIPLNRHYSVQQLVSDEVLPPVSQEGKESEEQLKPVSQEVPIKLSREEQRELFLDKRTQMISEAEYIYFEHARSSSFLVKGKEAFLRWVDLAKQPQHSSVDFKKASIPDLLAYLAKNNLRRIIEEVLCLRNEQNQLVYSAESEAIQVKELTLVLASNLANQERRLNINEIHAFETYVQDCLKAFEEDVEEDKFRKVWIYKNKKKNRVTLSISKSVVQNEGGGLKRGQRQQRDKIIQRAVQEWSYFTKFEKQQYIERSLGERWLKEHLDRQPFHDESINEYSSFLLKNIKNRGVKTVTKKWFRLIFKEWLKKQV